MEAGDGTERGEGGSGGGLSWATWGPSGPRVFSLRACIIPAWAAPRLMPFGPSIRQALWSPWGTRGSPPSCSCPRAACASPTPAPPGGCSCARRWARGRAAAWPPWVGDGALAVGAPAWGPSISSPHTDTGGRFPSPTSSGPGGRGGAGGGLAGALAGRTLTRPCPRPGVLPAGELQPPLLPQAPL